MFAGRTEPFDHGVDLLTLKPVDDLRDATGLPPVFPFSQAIGKEQPCAEPREKQQKD